MARILFCAVMISLLCAVPRPGRAAGEEPLGVWQNEAGTMRVRLAPCGIAFCGTIVWLKDARSDSYNPDPVVRRKPLLGLRILWGMMPSGNINEWKGTGYNPDDGRNYAQLMTTESDTVLLSHGCVLNSLVCQSVRWRKVN